MHPKLANLTDDQQAQLRTELRALCYGRRTRDAEFTSAAARQPVALRMLQTRADGTDGVAEETGLRVAGYSAVFDQRTEIAFDFMGIRIWWHEVIARGFFRKALARPDLDVRFLVNHDPSMLLARTANGTLRLEERTIGLYSDADLADTTLGRDTYELIRTGTMSQQSFAFTLAEGGDEWDDTDAYDSDTEWYLGLRTLRECDELFDTSPVTYPAYKTADVSVVTNERAADTGEESPEARIAQQDDEGSDQQLVDKGAAEGSTRAVPDDQTHQEEPPCPQHYSSSVTPSRSSSPFSRRRPSQAR